MRTKVPDWKKLGHVFFVVMSDLPLMVRSHPDSSISSHLICPIQLSYEFFIVISLTLYDRFGGRHAYFSWNNDLHSISKDERSSSC